MKPFIFITVGYIVGIIWGLYLKLSIVPIFFCYFIIFLLGKKKELLLVNKTQKYAKYIIIFMLFAIISNIQIRYLENKFNSLPDKIEKVDVIGTVIEVTGETEYSKNYVIKIDSSSNKHLYSNMKLSIYTSKDIKLKYGNQIKCSGKYEIPITATNYKQFDYKEYLKAENTLGIIRNIDNLQVIKGENLSFISLYINNLREEIKQNLLRLLRRRRKSGCPEFLFGDTKDISEEIIEDFKNSGIYHILAVSGTHVRFYHYRYNKGI